MSLLAARLLKQHRRLPSFTPTSVASDSTLSPKDPGRLAAFLTFKSKDNAVVTVIPPPFMVVKMISLGEPASILLQHFKMSGRNFFRKEYDVRHHRAVVTEYIAEYKDWLGALGPCPCRVEFQWAGPVACTADGTALFLRGCYCQA